MSKGCLIGFGALVILGAIAGLISYFATRGSSEVLNQTTENGTVTSPEVLYKYNVSVVFGPSGTSQQMGRMSVAVVSHHTRYNITLSKDPEYLIPKTLKSYDVHSPYQVNEIVSIDFVWFPPSKTPITNYLDVDRIILVPSYIQNESERHARTISFIGSSRVPNGYSYLINSIEQNCNPVSQHRQTKAFLGAYNIRNGLRHSFRTPVRP